MASENLTYFCSQSRRLAAPAAYAIGRGTGQSARFWNVRLLFLRCVRIIDSVPAEFPSFFPQSFVDTAAGVLAAFLFPSVTPSS